MDTSQILQDCIKKTMNYNTLRAGGINDEQSMKIAFGDKVARKTLEDLATIAMKQEIEKKSGIK